MSAAGWYQVQYRFSPSDPWFNASTYGFDWRWSARLFVWLYCRLADPPQFRIVRVRADGSREVVG